MKVSGINQTNSSTKTRTFLKINPVAQIILLESIKIEGFSKSKQIRQRESS